MITSSDLLFAFSCIHTNAQVNRFCVQKSTVYNTKMHYHFSISTLVCGVHGSDQSMVVALSVELKLLMFFCGGDCAVRSFKYQASSVMTNVLVLWLDSVIVALSIVLKPLMVSVVSLLSMVLKSQMASVMSVLCMVLKSSAFFWQVHCPRYWNHLASALSKALKFWFASVVIALSMVLKSSLSWYTAWLKPSAHCKIVAQHTNFNLF